MLNCVVCGAMGTVNEPSREEWGDAYRAPLEPYGWEDNGRVTLQQSGPTYVAGWSANGPSKKICVPKSPLSAEERYELTVLEDVVIKGKLNGNLFPFYLRSVQEDTGIEPTGAVKQLAAQIEALVDQGRMFTPAMMAIVIREYLREARTHVDH